MYSIEEPHAEMNDAFVATRSTDRPTDDDDDASFTDPSATAAAPRGWGAPRDGKS